MLSKDSIDLQPLLQFLRKPTPVEWLDYAKDQIPTLLIDHAHCERKAATTAINFIAKYPDRAELIALMSPLAREELLHFEKVIAIMESRNISFSPLQPSSYGQKLHKPVTKGGCIERLRDQLIVGAIIEARSCERFYALMQVINDEQLRKFYGTLLKSEARHFQDYLHLAKTYCGNIDKRLNFFITLENELIGEKDEVFRFHSGIPRLA